MHVNACRTSLYAGKPLWHNTPAVVTSLYCTIVGKSGCELGNPQGSLDKQLVSIKTTLDVAHNNGSDSIVTENEKYWIGGFIEGEGSWSITFKLSSAATKGIQVVPIFGVSQHESGKGVLERCQKALGNSGRLSIKKDGKNGPLWYLEIQALNEIKNFVIPFVLKYVSPFSARNDVIKLFITVVNMIDNKEHLTLDGLRRIIDLVFDTPTKKKGNRKYTKADLLSVLGDRQAAAALSKKKGFNLAKGNTD